MRNFKTLAAMMMTIAGLAMSLAPESKAEPSIPVDAVRVKGLADYRGKSLNVFYVSGREASIGAVGQTLQVRSVKAGPVRVAISQDGTADIPAAAVPRSGFDVFNFIVFVVSSPDRREVYLRNADGSVPADSRIATGETPADDTFQSERTFYVSLIKLGQLKSQQGNSSPVVLEP